MAEFVGGDVVVVPFPVTDLQSSNRQRCLNNRQKPVISSEQPCGIGCLYSHWICPCTTTFLGERRSSPISPI